MFRSPRRRAAGAALIVAALAFAGSAQAGAHDHGRTIRLLEADKQVQPTFVDTGKPGPSVGDMVIVRDGVTRTDGSPAGKFNQVCTLVELAGGPFTSTYECTGSFALDGGVVTVQGPFVPSAAEQSAAITGGTGAYRDAGGEAVVKAEADEIVLELTSARGR